MKITKQFVLILLSFSLVGFGQTADSAETTAKSFYNAWKAKNKKQIARISTPKVAKMKLLHYPPAESMKYKFEGCSYMEEDSFWICEWSGESGTGVWIHVKKLSGAFKVINAIEGLPGEGE